MEFSRQEYWPGLSFPTPGDLPDPVIKLASPALAGGFLNTASHQGSLKLPTQKSKRLCPSVPVGIQGLYWQASVLQETLWSNSRKTHQKSLPCLQELAGQTKTS